MTYDPAMTAHGGEDAAPLHAPSYLAGWNDAKAGRQYGEGREGEQRSLICGVVSQSGPNLEPLACGFRLRHEGPHAWATLPTFTSADAALYTLAEAQAVIDRWESTGGPTTTEVALARTVVALWGWNEWAGQRTELDALWDEWLRFRRGVHPDYETTLGGGA